MKIASTKLSPMISSDRVRFQPPSGKWTVGEKTYTTDEFLASADSFEHGTPVDYRYRTKSLSSTLGAMAAAIGCGAVAGAGIGLLPALATGDARLIASAAAAGAAGLGAWGLVGLAMLAEVTKTTGALEKQGDHLAYKMTGAKGALDLHEFARAKPNAYAKDDQWWNEVADVQRYPGAKVNF